MSSVDMVCYDALMGAFGGQVEELLDRYKLAGEIRHTVWCRLQDEMLTRMAEWGKWPGSWLEWAGGLLHQVIGSLSKEERQAVFMCLWGQGFAGLIASRYAPKYGVGWDDIADAEQDVALRAWQNFRQYDPRKGAFSTWVGTVINTVLYNGKRDAGRHNLATDAYLSELPPGVEGQPIYG